jgi:uncharacterized Ntn-hydrolase superfamily protein
MTFSIVARCPRNGMLGVATSSSSLASGAGVPYCRAGVGAIASQSFGNPYLGIDALTLLEHGLTAARAIERVIESDRGRELRQVGIVDRDGHTAAYSGSRCIPWAGHVEGAGYICLGNILTGEDVIKEMARAFEASIDEMLPERLTRALEAGQQAGGDRRGRQSAALYVVHTEEYPYCDLRVDDHPDPVAEMRRLYELFKEKEPMRERLAPRRDDFTPEWEMVVRRREMVEADLEEQEQTAGTKER